MAASEEKRAQKILRVGIIQNGRVIEEELFRERKPVNVGTRLKNSIVVASESFPESATVFDVKSGQYILQFSENMQGRVALGDGVHDLRSLVQSGRAKRNGDVYTLELSDRARGKVSVDDVTVLFQFVTPPPLAVLPQLPANMRGGFFYFVTTIAGLSAFFMLCLALVAIVHVASVVALRWWYPARTRLSAEELVQRQTRGDDPVAEVEEEEPPEPEEPEDAVPEDEGDEAGPEDEPQAQPNPTPTPNPTPAAPAEPAVSENVADAMAELMQEFDMGAAASSDTGGVSLSDVNAASRQAAASGRGRESSNADGGSAVLSASAGGAVGREGRGQGGGAIGAGVGGGDRAVEGGGQQQAIRARVGGGGMNQTGGGGEIDQQSVNLMLNQYSGAITTCYEQALRNNPSLQGSVTLEIEIGPNGLVTSKRMVNSSMGGQVDNCILQQASTWFFPSKPTGGSVRVQKTYILNPG